jgi:uncharacterized membrane protein (DUF106 family)
MRGKSESEAPTTEDSQPTVVESLSEAAIKKALRSDAVQHPATILPFTLFVLSIIYFVLFSPVLGGALPAIILLVASGLVAAGAFLWRYFVRYAEEYARRAQEIMELQDRERTKREEAELTQSQETLQTGFSSIGSDAGHKALEGLVHEYEEFRRVVSRRRKTDPMSIARVSALADETYRQGLSVLTDALELARAIHSSKVERLETELADLEKEIREAKADGSLAGLIEIKESTAKSHKERLDMIAKQQLRVDQLFYQSDRCEASMNRTRLELAALRVDSAETGVSAVIETLRGTINQAREVQEELRKLGF